MGLTFNPFTGTFDFTGPGGGGGGTPGSPDTSVQFNAAGSFGGSANFLWDGTYATFTAAHGLAFATGGVSHPAVIYGGDDVGSTTLTIDSPIDQYLEIFLPSYTKLFATGGGASFIAAGVANTGFYFDVDTRDPSTSNPYTFATFYNSGVTPGSDVYGTDFTTPITGLVQASGESFWALRNLVSFTGPTTLSGHTYGTETQYTFNGNGNSIAANKTYANFGRVVGDAGSGTVAETWVYGSLFNLTGGTFTTVRGFGLESITLSNAATFEMFWTPALTTVATNAYSFWHDEQGVYRIRADNTFDSVYQAITALYNPLFTKYTPGAPNFERIVTQWETNVATITTEKGGTGTLRALNLGDSGVMVTANGRTIATVPDVLMLMGA